MLATGFSVVTTLTRTCVIAEHLVLQYGFERRCRGIHGTDIAVLELDDPARHAARSRPRAADALAHDRSGAIVLGCAGMADLCRAAAAAGVPVIDGVAAAVKFAEALAGWAQDQQARRLRGAAAEALRRLGRRARLAGADRLGSSRRISVSIQRSISRINSSGSRPTLIGRPIRRR